MKLEDKDIITIDNKVMLNDSNLEAIIPDFDEDISVLYLEGISIDVFKDSPDDIFLNELYNCHYFEDKETNCEIFYEKDNLKFHCNDGHVVGKIEGAGINTYSILFGKIEKFKQT